MVGLTADTGILDAPPGTPGDHVLLDADMGTSEYGISGDRLAQPPQSSPQASYRLFLVEADVSAS
jgi:hypothetical protein